MEQIPVEVSLSLYERLYLVRKCDEMIVRIYPDDKMKTPMHMSLGQEAVPVGICLGLEGRGDVLTSYRSHAAFLAQTGDHPRFFAELHGRITGTADGKSGSMHLAWPESGMLGASGIVGSGIPVSIGVGFANKRMGNNRMAAVFFGDGATDEGCFWESLNSASVMQLPVFFICEDNGFAVHTDQSTRRGFKSITDVVRQFECLVYSDESNDVESIYRLARMAEAECRAQKKPVFFNLKCHRYLEHVGIREDWTFGYRNKDDYSNWPDSVALQRSRLLERGFSDAELVNVEREIDDAIQQSVDAALAAPLPTPDYLYRGVFNEKN